MKAIVQPTLVALFAATLTACGGGGGGDGGGNDPTPVASLPQSINEGAYTGTTSNPSATKFNLLVLEDGSLWSIYGNQVGTTFQVMGFLQGQGSFSQGQVTAPDIRDHAGTNTMTASLTGTYTSTPSIAGTVAYASVTVTFSGTPIPDSTYVYSTPALISNVSGSWSLNMTTGETASVVISNTGSVGGVSSLGCQFSGSVTPRPSGKNVFNVALNFGPSPCALPGQTATGVALSYPLATGQRQLIVLGQTADRSRGLAAFGQR